GVEGALLRRVERGPLQRESAAVAFEDDRSVAGDDDVDVDRLAVAHVDGLLPHDRRGPSRGRLVAVRVVRIERLAIEILHVGPQLLLAARASASKPTRARERRSVASISMARAASLVEIVATCDGNRTARALFAPPPTT